MVKIKICGITNLKDALSCIDGGADALGFIFYKKSPRYITAKKAAAIIKKLPKSIIKVGVFVNEKGADIKKIAKVCGLNFVQLHGNESIHFCAKLKGLNIIKAFRVKEKIDKNEVSKYKVKAYLFDAFVRSKAGGTGKSFNWSFLCGINKLKIPVFLSGGLNAGNVIKAIKSVRPNWVDVCTSVENAPGEKDREIVREFIKAVKRG